MIYNVTLDPPMLDAEVEAESEDDAITIALLLFAEQLHAGTWEVREVEEGAA